MCSRFVSSVAFRYLRARRKEGFVSVIAGFSFLGIMLGVATLIVVMSVMNGFRTELLDRILGINAHISITSATEQIEDYDALRKELAQIGAIEHHSAVVSGQALATANDRHIGASVRGISLEDLKGKTTVYDSLEVADFTPYAQGTGIILGKRMAKSLGVFPGETIQLISPQTNTTIFGVIPRLKDFTVIGTFDVGMYEYDSSLIFMPLGAAQTYFRVPGAVTDIEVMLQSPSQLEEVKAEILERIDSPPYYLFDWQRANRHYLQSLEVERNVMFLILTLIIIVAAFNVISGMVMMVTGKQKEIAILRTMGATRGSIMRIFILSGSMIGVLGTFFGFLLGVGFAKNIETIRGWLESATGTELFAAEIYFLSKLPAEVQNGDVITVVVMALAISILATIYPAWKAANVSPAEGVRHA